MSNSFNEKKLNFIINVIYILLLFAILYLLLRYALPIIFPFVIAIAVSCFIEPYVLLLINKMKLKRGAASIICLITVIAVLILLIFLVSATVFTGAKQVIAALPQVFENIENRINGIINAENGGMLNDLVSKIYFEIKNTDTESLMSGSVGNLLVKSFSGIMSSLPYLFIATLTTVISTVFISSSFNDVKVFILNLFTDRGKKLIISCKDSINTVGRKYIKTYLTLMLITFIELTVLFVIFDIRPAASIALIISFVDILPILGVGTVLVPWAVINLISGNVSGFFIMLSIYILVTVVRQIIEPKIIGDNTGLPPIIALIAIYVGLKLFGILGMFLVPMILVIIGDLHKKGQITISKIY